MNDSSFKLKGLGYFIDKLENKLFEIFKKIYLNSIKCTTFVKLIICNLVMKLFEKENLTKFSRYILTITIFYTISKQIYRIFEKKENLLNKIFLSKSDLFFSTHCENTLDFQIKITSKKDKLNNFYEYLFPSNKKPTCGQKDSNNKPFFTIIKAYLDYENYKKNFY